MTSPLPIDEVLPQLVEVLQGHSCVVLQAPPGAGKTTRVPPALLEAQRARHGQILMLEPRRIAARSAARRMASELHERVGQTVGYRIRFDEAVSKATRILVMTEGVLLRRLQDDPFLEGVDVVVFDEFHERRLDSDLALAMTRRVQQTVRPDLQVVVMSATLNAAPIAQFLGDCPIVESQGRLYPVRIDYQRSAARLPMTTQAVQGIERVLNQTEGDVLVFLPGVGEIMKTQRELEPLMRQHNLAVFPLFGDMAPEDQDKVLSPADRRKVVLSTNVAETSVTIEGITAVVDTGYARQVQFDADVGLDRLELTPISKASADQRAGRAGRTSAGFCLRLWDETTHRARRDFDTAELHRVDLSGAVLRLHAWGESDISEFPWFERPPDASLAHADRLLHLLGALRSSAISEPGRQMTKLPVSPRIARLLIEGARLGEENRCSLLAAMLSERSPFMERQPSKTAGHGLASTPALVGLSQSDVLDRLVAFEVSLKTHQTETPFGTINIGTSRTIQQVARQLRQSLNDVIPAVQIHSQTTSPGNAIEEYECSSDDAVLKSLVAAFPDRVAKRRDTGSDKALMVGGRGVRLGPRSSVRTAPLFLCVDIDGAGVDATVRQASEVRREWLPKDLMHSADELFFHPSQKQVVARRRTRFDDLILDETPTSIVDSAAAADVLLQAAKTNIGQVLPANDEAVSSFLARVRSLAVWMPELKLVEFDESMMLDVLRELCEGRRSFQELIQGPWLMTLQSRLDYATLQTIDREVPERLQVPSGNRIRLIYEPGRPPVLPVRIQEVFGWKQTPRVAGGRVSVLLHLLAPNMRPQQITDDLASFWANTYPEVRKELKRRYPKHAWPDDPLTAQPVRKR